jgi:predicted nucleotide-binding protein
MADGQAGTILVVDDDPFELERISSALRDRLLKVAPARSPKEALDFLASRGSEISLVVVDVMLPTDGLADERAARGGFHSGIQLARAIMERQPSLPVVGCSRFSEAEPWFRQHTKGFINRNVYDRPERVADRVLQIVMRANPTVFIVHGHDGATKLELKTFLQNTLHLGEPRILHELPNGGRTILEKFEAHAAVADLVFVLLTPDDKMWTPDAGVDVRRARQNVIFEMGYFLGKLGRLSGRVLLLFKGALDVPSDITGLLYVDISDGIEAAGEAIRKEVQEWLHS